MKSLAIFLLLLLAYSNSFSQNNAVVIDGFEYRELKSQGLIHPNFSVLSDSNIQEHVQIQPSVSNERDGFCDCWIEPNDTYTLSDFGPFGTDDGSTDNIPFGFDFEYFGEVYNSLWINSNGTITFDGANGTFTSQGFPNNNVLLAPFWADVDFGCDGCGDMYYKVTDDAVYINWVEVGYYNNNSDKTNSFQVIITPDGSQVIQGESTVEFCYLDMQWTTGGASGGAGGFGGSPANVGLNAGNNEDFISVGLFNENSDNFDGPLGLLDGINSLDNQQLSFNPNFSAFTDPAPMVFGHNSCDTIAFCQNTTLSQNVSFIAIGTLEATEITVNNGGYTNLEFSTEENMGTTTVSLLFNNGMENGVYEIAVTGANINNLDNSTTVSVYVKVDNDIVIPVLNVLLGGEASESATYCSSSDGVFIEANEGFENYSWSNGITDPSAVFQSGEYSLIASVGACQSESGPFLITQVPSASPQLVVSQNFLCEDETTLISIPTFEQFDSVYWEINGPIGQIISTDLALPEVEVTAGNYSIIAYTEGGCTQESFITVLEEFVSVPQLNIPPVYNDNQVFWSDAYTNPNPCVTEFMMFDSETDAWEGASINVFVDGIGPYTYFISNGFGQVLDGIDVYHGQLIEYYFNSGNDDDDVGLTIWNTENEVVFNSADGDVIASGPNPFFSQIVNCGFSALEGSWNVDVISGSEDYTIEFPSVFNPLNGANSFTIPEGGGGEYLLTFTTANCNTEIEFPLNFISVSAGQVFDSNNNSSILINLAIQDPTIHSFINTSDNSFSYIYIVTDQNNNIISSSGSVFDFAGFDVGNYNVYGLSYSALPVINIGMNIFLMNLTDGALLSTNHIDVNIIDSPENLTEIDAQAPIFNYSSENITVTNLNPHQTITLMDAGGKLVYQEETQDDTWNLEVSTFSFGAYFITVTSENGNSYSFKMAK